MIRLSSMNVIYRKLIQWLSMMDSLMTYDSVCGDDIDRHS